MLLTIIGIETGDAAEEVRKIVEESKVTVLEWEHDPTTKQLHLTLDGPDANFTLRNKLAAKNVRADWVTGAYRG